MGVDDTSVIPLKEAAQQRLRVTTTLMLTPGVSHLFEEPGTLGEASALARDWFLQHLAPEASRAARRTEQEQSE